MWPYPNVLVYVVHSRDGEGCSQTLHRNYLLPINSNLEQDEKDEPVIGVGNDTSPTSVSFVGSAPAEARLSGWSHQTWQITHLRTVQIDLLHSVVALEPPGTNFHGGIKILVCWPILDQPASGMHRLACLSAYISYFVCIPFSGDIQCRAHFLGREGSGPKDIWPNCISPTRVK